VSKYLYFFPIGSRVFVVVSSLVCLDAISYIQSFIFILFYTSLSMGMMLNILAKQLSVAVSLATQRLASEGYCHV
jgi:hypothetical protein